MLPAARESRRQFLPYLSLGMRERQGQLRLKIRCIILLFRFFFLTLQSRYGTEGYIYIRYRVEL